MGEMAVYYRFILLFHSMEFLLGHALSQGQHCSETLVSNRVTWLICGQRNVDRKDTHSLQTWPIKSSIFYHPDLPMDVDTQGDLKAIWWMW